MRPKLKHHCNPFRNVLILIVGNFCKKKLFFFRIGKFKAVEYEPVLHSLKKFQFQSHVHIWVALHYYSENNEQISIWLISTITWSHDPYSFTEACIRIKNRWMR